MSKKHNHESVDTNIESLSKAEAFIAKNNKKIAGGLVAVAVIVIGFLSIRSCNDAKIAESQEAFTFTGNSAYMAVDSLSNAEALADLEAYIAEYGNKAVGIAAFQAGVAAFELKDYNKAIEYFEQYEGEDEIYNARALACIADCYIELGNYEKALQYYSDAVAAADNDFASEYAFRAGLVAEKLGNNEQALSFFNVIKNQYPSSPRAMEVEKYISRIENK